MLRSTLTATFAAATLAISSGGVLAASAVQKECSAKYQAAKAGDQLKGLTYNQFYSQCAAEARAEKSGTAAGEAPAVAKAAPAPVAPAGRAPAAPAGSPVFPTAVSPEFSKMTAGKARMQTCLAQYRANKDTNGNGGMRWIQKGGGYYSACNKRLKG